MCLINFESRKSVLPVNSFSKVKISTTSTIKNSNTILVSTDERLSRLFLHAIKHFGGACLV